MTDSGQSSSRTRTVALLLGLLLLAALVMGTCHFAGLKKPTELAQPTTINPPPAAVAPRPELKPGLEVVARDEAAGLITLRDTQTGDTVQINTADFSNEKVDKAFAQLIASRKKAAPPAAPAGETAPAVATPPPVPPDNPPEQKPSGPLAGDGANKPVPVTAPPAPETSLPPFVPLYPGATTIKIATTNDHGAIKGDYEFSTPDAPEKIGRFYAEKLAAGGLLVIANVAGSNPNGPTFTLIAEEGGSGKTLSLTAGIESGRTRGSITFEAK